MVAITKANVAASTQGKQAPVVGAGMPFGFTNLFWDKTTYEYVANDFHMFHQHDLNCLIHFFTTTLGVWGAMQIILELTQHSHSIDHLGIYVVGAYAMLIAFTTPMITAVLHTALIYACFRIHTLDVSAWITTAAYGDVLPSNMALPSWFIAGLAVVAGYGLQDLSHYLCCEPTFMDSYLKQGKAWMLIVHSIWLLPLVIDSILMRHLYLPFLVTRNRNVICPTVASRSAVEALRDWIHTNIPSTPETTHVWPHKQEPTAKATLQLENDAAIEAAFRTVFPKKHYDVIPVQDMNEIYVTAVGAKKSINSDAVFYTPHCDGPYWFLPGASLYRVLVGVTPNVMVRTRFNLQHVSQDQVLDMYGVVGFDYNRELHWIDHVPNVTNADRRSLLKLHFVVYPKGWHSYGKFCAYLNTSYNTWARGNFLTTLRPSGMYEYVMAWWIWLTTWGNAVFVEVFGWDNLVYIAASYMMGPLPFLILTSFRHYAVYVTTFAYRQPMVAHGYLMRDARLYKTLSMLHLARRLLPMVQLPRDIPGLLVCTMGFMITLLATARLGMVRTYFGTELNFVKPQWIEGFPYGTIPHPMIVGQIFGFAAILYWWRNEITKESATLLLAHISCYTFHMVQEILTGGY
jgi:Phospholipid methyltransferase